jgi:hypothetical protein
MNVTKRQGISGWQALGVIATCVAMMVVIVSIAPQ